VRGLSEAAPADKEEKNSDFGRFQSNKRLGDAYSAAFFWFFLVFESPKRGCDERLFSTCTITKKERRSRSFFL